MVWFSRSRSFCARTQGSRICTSISLKWSYQSHRCILYLMSLSMTLFGLKTAMWLVASFRDIEVQILNPCVLAQKIWTVRFTPIWIPQNSRTLFILEFHSVKECMNIKYTTILWHSSYAKYSSYMNAIAISACTSFWMAGCNKGLSQL